MCPGSTVRPPPGSSGGGGVGEGVGETVGPGAGELGPPGAAAVVGCPAEPALPLLLPHPLTASTAAASTTAPASGRPLRNTNSSVLYTGRYSTDDPRTSGVWQLVTSRRASAGGAAPQ